MRNAGNTTFGIDRIFLDSPETPIDSYCVLGSDMRILARTDRGMRGNSSTGHRAKI